MVFGLGCRSSHRRKMRTVSMPAAAIRVKSRRTTAGVVAGEPVHGGLRRPVVDAEAEPLSVRQAPAIACSYTATYWSTMRSTPNRSTAMARILARSSAAVCSTASDGAGDVGDEHSGHTVVDELGHGAPVERDDGGAAGHRFDDAVAERLVEVDEVQQRSGTAEEGAIGPRHGPGRGSGRGRRRCGARPATRSSRRLG